MARTVEKMDHGETWEWVAKWVREADGVTLPDYLSSPPPDPRQLRQQLVSAVD